MNEQYPVQASLKRHSRFAFSVFLSIILLLVLVVGVFAARNFLWQDQFGSDGKYDSAYGVAAQDDKVFVSGWLETESFGVDWVIRAYDANNGSVIWQDNSIPPVGGIAVDGNRVFAIGSRQISFGKNGWAVRAYDTETGLLLWEDQHDFPGSARVVVLKDSQIFVLGSSINENGTSVWVIRVYNPVDGTLLQQIQIDLGDSPAFLNKFFVQGNRLFVAGSIQSGSNSQDWLIRAYDTDSGTLLWQDQFDLAGGYDFLNDVVVSRTQVIMVGSGPNDNGDYDWLVRAYDIVDGSLLWQDQFDRNGGGGSAFAVTAEGQQIYVAGNMADSQGSLRHDAVLRVYNQGGSLLWEDYYNLAGSFDGYSEIAVKRGQIIVAGTAGDSSGNYGWLVRSYNSQRRTLLWQDYKAGGFWDFVVDMTVNDNQVFIVGDSTDELDVQDWLVRAYSLGR